MKFKAKTASWDKIEVDALAVLVTEEDYQTVTSRMNIKLDGQLHNFLANEGFSGKEGQFIAFPSGGRLAAKIVYVLGVGKKGDLTLSGLRKLAATLGKKAKSSGKKTLAIDLVSELTPKIAISDSARVLVEGLELGTYRYEKYKTVDQENKNELTDVWFLVPPAKLQHITNAITNSQIGVAGTLFARDLINESPTITTPTYLANAAMTLWRQKNIKVEIMDEKDVRKLGMGAYLAVTRGSAEPLKFIKLVYSGGGKKKIVLA